MDWELMRKVTPEFYLWGSVWVLGNAKNAGKEP